MRVPKAISNNHPIRRSKKLIPEHVEVIPIRLKQDTIRLAKSCDDRSIYTRLIVHKVVRSAAYVAMQFGSRAAFEFVKLERHRFVRTPEDGAMELAQSVTLHL